MKKKTQKIRLAHGYAVAPAGVQVIDISEDKKADYAAALFWGKDALSSVVVISDKCMSGISSSEEEKIISRVTEYQRIPSSHLLILHPFEETAEMDEDFPYKLHKKGEG